jgi:ribosomal protein S18 acetylase RimI-like enzyme
MAELELRRLGVGDDAVVERAAALFDKPLLSAATAAFLASDDHYFILALLDGEPAGFISGVEMIHPDKGTEMFLYELGVAEEARRQGVGTALVRALADLARERGCYGMWVLTDADNDAAQGTYRKAGAGSATANTMLEWRFER